MSTYFAGSPNQHRTRRASDAMTVAIGLLVFLWALLNTARLLAFEQAVSSALMSFPEWFDQVYNLVYLFGFLWTAFLVGLVLSQGKKRLRVLRDIAVAAAVTGIVLVLIHQNRYGEFPSLFPEFTDSIPSFPVGRLVTLTAIVTVTAPSLVRPLKRVGWWSIGLVGVATVGLGYALPGDAIGAIGLGVAIAGGTLLAFGSPGGYPSANEMRSAVQDLGLNVSSLSVDPIQTWDARIMNGTLLDDGTPIRVKALGRDAADSQFLNRIWRGMWYKDEPRSQGYGRVERVEHEALVSLMASRAGVSVPGVVAVGTGGEDIALLVTTEPDRLVEVANDAELVASWRQVGDLHRAAIGHGDLTDRALGWFGGGSMLMHFAGSTLHSPERQFHIDVVSLLYATALTTDAQTAVRCAIDGLGADRVAAALPFVQIPALSHTEKKRTKSPKIVLADIHFEIVEQTGTEPTTPERLRRVKPSDLVMPVLSLIAVYALVGMLTDIDFVAVWEVVKNATWALIVIGFIIGQTVYFPEATGMRFATGYDLVLRPLVVLQLSVKWIGLAVPSAAGRVAMNTAYLRKYGVPATVAVSQGAIDGISGFFVESVILIIAFIGADLPTMSFDLDDVPWGLIIVIVLFLVFAAVMAVLKIQRIRKVVMPIVSDAWGLLVDLGKKPSRIIGLLLSNLASRLILAVVLWFILQAIGAPLPLVTCLVATVATNLLAGLVPVPGGIGVAEAVLTTFLVFFGLDSDTAFAAAVVFRVATFYIPAGEGFFAMRWLDKEGYI